MIGFHLHLSNLTVHDFLASPDSVPEHSIENRSLNVLRVTRSIHRPLMHMLRTRSYGMVLVCRRLVTLQTCRNIPLIVLPLFRRVSDQQTISTVSPVSI